jgi:hypothetical protein
MFKRTGNALVRFLAKHLLRPLHLNEVTSESVSGAFTVYEVDKVYIACYKGKAYGFYKTMDETTGNRYTTLSIILLGLHEAPHKVKPFTEESFTKLQKKQGRALFLNHLTADDCNSLLKLLESDGFQLNPKGN